MNKELKPVKKSTIWICAIIAVVGILVCEVFGFVNIAAQFLVQRYLQNAVDTAIMTPGQIVTMSNYFVKLLASLSSTVSVASIFFTAMAIFGIFKKNQEKKSKPVAVFAVLTTVAFVNAYVLVNLLRAALSLLPIMVAMNTAVVDAAMAVISGIAVLLFVILFIVTCILVTAGKRKKADEPEKLPE